MFPQGIRREGAWGEQVRERSRQAFGREYLKPGCEWLKKLAPLTEKSRGGLQAQLDPGTARIPWLVSLCMASFSSELCHIIVSYLYL